MIYLYVDDMLLFGTDLNEDVEMKKLLSNNFAMKDIREAYVIVRIKMIKNNNYLSLFQFHYIEKILKSLNILIIIMFSHHLILVWSRNKVKVVLGDN